MGMFRPWIGCLVGLLTISILIHVYLFTNVSEKEKMKRLQQNDLESIVLEAMLKDLTNVRPKNANQLEKIIQMQCNVIHVAMVSAGYNATFSTATVVKSILFYRRNPLHFHLVVDEVANRTLQTLFQSWNLPNVELTYYRSEDLVPRVSWIRNRHYSGVYGLLKLILPDIIKEDKVIVLDTDLTVSTDIGQLWKLFDNFEKKQVIGLVENQSDWYIKPFINISAPWPALGRGFNTGVILMHLNRLRSMNFSNMWYETSRVPLKKNLETHLADQDIINVLIKEHPYIVYKLPCTWNIQFSTHTLSEACYTNTNEINIIHWNSPKRQGVNTKHSDDFRKAYQIFLELDGNLLKRQLFVCTGANVPQRPYADYEPCEKFDQTASIKYRTHLFLLEYESGDHSTSDVTLTTQCSADRLTLLEDLCKRWPGAISISLYFTDAEAYNFMNFVRGSEELKKRRNIAYHVVYKEGEFYPVNYLRNVAMSHVATSYVFQLDVDFLPPRNLYEVLQNSIARFHLNEHSQIALVVPAFETERYRFSFPKSKELLVKSLNRGVFYTFRYHIWSQGHAATNYTHWCMTHEPYEVSWEPDFEPYVVVHKSAPAYDNRFVGFGWNKVSHIAHLAAAGYRFVVIPDGFVIHRPHAPSFDIIKFRQDTSYRKCLKKLKDKFIEELLTTYKESVPENFKKHYSSHIKNVEEAQERIDAQLIKI